ncbi:hypothetical protein QFZ57_003143 [Arthrobacter sp. B1I2]|nr:hypothetical protein [Arthrobacter sp. B1I2]
MALKRSQSDARPGRRGESPVFPAEFNLAPFMLGLALLLVAGVFEYGRRLHRDTEGLV